MGGACSMKRRIVNIVKHCIQKPESRRPFVIPKLTVFAKVILKKYGAKL
jgi:hypothetical protein